jgi:transposase
MAYAASRHPRDLTDRQWDLIGPFLPELPRREDGRGRPWRENRLVLNGILWILDLQEAFIDGSFAPAKRGGVAMGKTKRGKGSKIMAIADCQGRPVAVHVESATPHEVRLVHATPAGRLVRQRPVRLIGDNAYESDRLDAELARHGVELIAPHRRTRTQRTQDGRALRRYQRRSKIERLFAWFQNFRRIVVRYERLAENFLGMLHLACCLILLRGL